MVSATNPKTPFVCYLDKKFYSARIQGVVKSNADNFAINLSDGPMVKTYEGNVAFHMSPRFPTSIVVRNSMTSSKWHTNEDRDGKMPLSRGAFFQIDIVEETHHFKVDVNGVHFCNYVHRLPVIDIKYLTIFGDVNISSVVCDEQAGFLSAQRPGGPGPGPGSGPGQGNFRRSSDRGGRNRGGPCRGHAPSVRGNAGDYGWKNHICH